MKSLLEQDEMLTTQPQQDNTNPTQPLFLPSKGVDLTLPPSVWLESRLLRRRRRRGGLLLRQNVRGGEGDFPLHRTTIPAYWRFARI
jgi:hypothetical protein